MKLNKVLICAPSHTLRGGVESIVNDLCKELPRRGWQTTLALARGARFNDPGAYARLYPGLPIVELDCTGGSRHSRIRSIQRAIHELQPDIVLSARIFDALPAVEQLKRTRAFPRLAWIIQGYESSYFFDLRLYRETVDMCIVAGNLIRETAIGWGGLAGDRLAVVRNGVSLPQHSPSPRTRRGRRIQIGHAGRLEQEQKRILDLIPFANLLDAAGLDYCIDIIGTGSMEGTLKDALRKPIDAGRIAFHGWQDKQALYSQYYPNMDCFIHFAEFEGVPIAPAEAMAHGAVPVISRFTGIVSERQFVHETNALVFPVGDCSKAAECVARLAGETGLMERLSANGIDLIRESYSVDGTMDAWAEALDRCMEMPQVIPSGPEVRFPADGRLTHLGLPPWAAQRVRDLLGRRAEYSDPGSEWPHTSGLMPDHVSREISDWARNIEMT